MKNISLLKYSLFTLFLTIITVSGFAQSKTITDELPPEDCIPPYILSEYISTDDFNVTFCWELPNEFDPMWIGYDDGINVDAFGGFAEFSYAAKWDPSQLFDFDGTAITKVKFFPREGGSFTLKIWKGANASTLLYEQPLSGLTLDEWNEIDLDTPVAIDITDELWIGFYLVTDGYNAGCGYYTGNYNSDLVSLDGVNWEHIGDLGFSYSWNLAAYVEGAKGAIAELPSLVDNITNSSSNAVDSYAGDKELLGYNIYRDGTQVNDELIIDSCYTDSVGYAGLICYEVTAVYSICGESDPSNEACIEVALGANELENKISVYPNPAQDFVMIKASSNILSISITNYMGQIVSSTKKVKATQTRIETSSLSAGIYFFKIETEAGIETVKIVISR